MEGMAVKIARTGIVSVVVAVAVGSGTAPVWSQTSQWVERGDTGRLIYTLDAESMVAGAEELRVLLAQWAWCKAQDEWPNYGATWNGHAFDPPKVQTLSLPEWAIRESERRAG